MGMTIGQKIKEARLSRGLTQKELVGDRITRNMLSKIENDSATPSMKTLEFLAGQMGLPASYFLEDSRLSDGTSPDGLDDMRTAYREKRYKDCIALLETSRTCGTTDEGYLLHALACLGAATDALTAGDAASAQEYADAADYYNKEGIYYSAAIDAEMSLVLAECAMRLDPEEFTVNAKEYERAVKEISFSRRYAAVCAEYKAATGDYDSAEKLLEEAGDMCRPECRRLYIEGRILSGRGDYEGAIEKLTQAENAAENDMMLQNIYEATENCWRELGNFEKAYIFAKKRLDFKAR
jgi:transcriptional regulator with XRE-family HTH domain